MTFYTTFILYLVVTGKSVLSVFSCDNLGNDLEDQVCIVMRLAQKSLTLVYHTYISVNIHVELIREA